MARLTVARPESPRVSSSPERIKQIWAEAHRESRKEAATLRARRRRARAAAEADQRSTRPLTAL
jgi:hypothetical protein